MEGGRQSMNKEIRRNPRGTIKRCSSFYGQL
jgi:hypothetical protein